MKKILIIPLIALLLICIPFAMRTDEKNSYLVFATGTPDDHDNRIGNLTISQLNGAWFVVSGTITYDTYTYPPGWEVTCLPNKNTRFNVTVYLNNSLADNASDAVTKTRVYITIATGGFAGTPEAGWNSRLMNDGHTEGASAPYYWITWYEDWTTAGKPDAGTVFYVTIDYDTWY